MVQRSHVVEAVGELDQDDPDVIHHRQQHLAEVLGLTLLGRGQADGADLGHTFDDMRDFGAEQLMDALDRGEGVLDDVVKQTGRHGDDVQLHVGQEVCNCQRMDEIGLPRVAHLSPVLEGREDVGPPEQLDIGVRAVCPDLFHEILEANHEIRCLSIILT